jgi:AcrR family transcriptional regulator
MSRWEPDARGRLLHAAIDLFSEHGYGATTAAQIAERAGLTKTTLFRHFADKREILFQGQEALISAAVGGVDGAPAGASAADLLRAGISGLCGAHSSDLRDTGRRLDPILAQSSELQERAVFKRFAITQALHGALTIRVGDARQAAVLADIGVRAYYEGFATWILSTDDRPLLDAVCEELAAYEEVLAKAGVNPSRRRREPVAS